MKNPGHAFTFQRPRRAVHTVVRRAAVAGACAFLIGVTAPAAADVPREALPVAAAVALPTQTLTVPNFVDPSYVEHDQYVAGTVIERASYTAGFTPTHSGLRWPFSPEHLTDTWGPRSCEGCSPMHHGLDFAPGDRTPIPVIGDGFVREVVNGDGSLGTFVVVEHIIDGRSVLSRYAHMTAGFAQVQVGQLVIEGDILGLIGDTGQSTGPHLHFEIWDGGDRVDPYMWLVENVLR